MVDVSVFGLSITSHAGVACGAFFLSGTFVTAAQCDIGHSPKESNARLKLLIPPCWSISPDEIFGPWLERDLRRSIHNKQCPF